MEREEVEREPDQDGEPAGSDTDEEDELTAEDLEILRREAEDARREVEDARVHLESTVCGDEQVEAIGERSDTTESEAAAVAAAAHDIPAATAEMQALGEAAREAEEEAARQEAARQEAWDAATVILEECLTPALEKIELRDEALTEARSMLEVLLAPAMEMEAAAIALAIETARAERAAARAAAKATAEEAARQRRINPPPEDYPGGMKPPDSITTNELPVLAASPTRKLDVDAQASATENLHEEVRLRAGRSLSWGAPRQGRPDEAVYGWAVSTPINDLVEQERQWLKICSRQMTSSVTDRLHSNKREFGTKLPDAVQAHGSMPSGCATGSSSRPFLAPYKQADVVRAHCRKIQQKEEELRNMTKRLGALSSGMPFLEQQIHAGSRVMGQYDQSAREIKILQSVIQVREAELRRLGATNPVVPAPAVVAFGKDHAERMLESARFSLHQQIAASTRSLARAQQQVSHLACSLRSKDVVVRSGKKLDVETERDAFASKYCERPHSALREMSRLTHVQAEALALSKRLSTLEARQRVGLLAVHDDS